MKSNTGNNINNTNTCSCHGQRNRLIKELLCLFSDLFLFISVLLVLVVYGQKMRSVFFSVVILHLRWTVVLFFVLNCAGTTICCSCLHYHRTVC